MQQFGTYMFHTVVHWHKLFEVENECTLHDFIILAIFVPKIIKCGKHLTKLCEKQFWLFFLDTLYILLIERHGRFECCRWRTKGEHHNHICLNHILLLKLVCCRKSMVGYRCGRLGYVVRSIKLAIFVGMVQWASLKVISEMVVGKVQLTDKVGQHSWWTVSRVIFAIPGSWILGLAGLVVSQSRNFGITKKSLKYSTFISSLNYTNNNFSHLSNKIFHAC